jgi:hypothetical protein
MPWVEENDPKMTCDDFGKDAFLEYRNHLMAIDSRLGRPYQNNTINCHLSGLHAYLEYLVDLGVRIS